MPESVKDVGGPYCSHENCGWKFSGPHLHLVDEVWKPVPGYEGRYEASTFGHVRSLLGREPTILASFPNSSGYLTVSLYRNGGRKTFLVHHLVLLSFEGPCPDGLEARHLNDQKADNGIKNLCWGTRKQNRADAKRNGTQPLGSDVHNAKLDETAVEEAKDLRKKGWSFAQIASRYGVHRSSISRAIRGKTWGHAGI